MSNVTNLFSQSNIFSSKKCVLLADENKIFQAAKTLSQRTQTPYIPETLQVERDITIHKKNKNAPIELCCNVKNSNGKFSLILFDCLAFSCEFKITKDRKNLITRPIIGIAPTENNKSQIYVAFTSNQYPLYITGQYNPFDDYMNKKCSIYCIPKKYLVLFNRKTQSAKQPLQEKQKLTLMHKRPHRQMPTLHVLQGQNL